jgi:hypothetical protein
MCETKILERKDEKIKKIGTNKKDDFVSAFKSEKLKHPI